MSKKKKITFFLLAKKNHKLQILYDCKIPGHGIGLELLVEKQWLMCLYPNSWTSGNLELYINRELWIHQVHQDRTSNRTCHMQLNLVSDWTVENLWTLTDREDVYVSSSPAGTFVFAIRTIRLSLSPTLMILA